MNKKICALILLSASMHVMAGPDCEHYDKILRDKARNNANVPTDQLNAAKEACEREMQKEARRRKEQDRAQNESRQKQAQIDGLNQGISEGFHCKQVFDNVKALDQQAQAQAKKTKAYKDCIHLKAMSLSLEKKDITLYKKNEKIKRSVDQKITCDQPYSYTVDYDPCLKALAAYNIIINSESFMNLTQQVRTDTTLSKINNEAVQTASSGDTQTALYDASIKTDTHMKRIEQEKAAAYSSAVAALTVAYQQIPDEKDAIKECYRAAAQLQGNSEDFKQISQEQKSCEAVLDSHKDHILANQDNKAAIFEAITKFVAKGIEAGIKMNQYDKKAKAVAEVKKSYEDDAGTDMMIELCEFNPADPACVTAGPRVSSGSSFSAGEFSFGTDSGNNAFNLTPEGSGEFGEIGAPTDLDDKNEVASVNSPFADDAKIAKGILDPAAAAQTQASGGTQGGGGGVSGGMGGGSASLGGDLQGEDKSGDKEAQIKAGNVAGLYNNVGGGGYKAVSRGKDDKANPFSSLFDQKSESGGVEEDRSIASGDIDGKASALFQKISKRYSQVHADKRVEAKNLE